MRKIYIGRDGRYALAIQVPHRYPRKKKKAIKARATGDVWEQLIRTALGEF
jgi:hypothetical protein